MASPFIMDLRVFYYFIILQRLINGFSSVFLVEIVNRIKFEHVLNLDVNGI